jgi:hypothetical protein
VIPLEKKRQMPFVAGETRLPVRTVKAAGWAFIGAKRRALTELAGGSGAGFSEGRAEDEKSSCERFVQKPQCIMQPEGEEGDARFTWSA